MTSKNRGRAKRYATRQSDTKKRERHEETHITCLECGIWMLNRGSEYCSDCELK